MADTVAEITKFPTFTATRMERSVIDVKGNNISQLSLDKFTPQTGVVVDNNQLTIDGTYVANSPIFFNEVGMRGMECTLVDLGGTTSQNVRIVFGYDQDNYCLVIFDGGNFVRRVGSISDVTKINSAELGAVTIPSGSRLRFTINNSVVQFFINDEIIGTYVLQSISMPDFSRNKIGFAWRNNTNLTKYSDLIMHKQTKKYMHLSIDDVLICLQELKEGTYTSIFDHPTFAFLKSLHDKYGAVFSLYLFYQNLQFNLSHMTASFKNEFLQCSDWLKFGFHALSSGANYGDGTISPSDAKTHYDNTINEIIRFAGGYSIDRIIRTGYYSGDLATCQQWKNTTLGVKGFMTADDDRAKNVYLNTQQIRAVRLSDDLLDKANGFYNVQTDIRVETTEDVTAALNLRMTDFINHGGNQRIHAVFTHEARLIDNTAQSKLEEACKWAINNRYEFDFPMNNIPTC